MTQPVSGKLANGDPAEQKARDADESSDGCKPETADGDDCTFGRGSVSVLISKVKEGDEDAVRELWNRYSGALIRSAQSRLGKQNAAKLDSEDLAQSVFYAIYRGAVEDKFDRLHDRAGFWTLVLAITRRKAVDRLRRVTAKKRGGSHGLRTNQRQQDASGISLVDEIISPELDPQLQVECDDLLEFLQRKLELEDPSGMLTRISVARLAGLTVKQIAKEVGRTERTIERKLNLVRTIWTETYNG